LKRGGSSSLSIQRENGPYQVQTSLAARLSSQGFDQNYLTPLTPLWLFVLGEAETAEGSQRLGQLGSHIVAAFQLGVSVAARARCSMPLLPACKAGAHRDDRDG
jgi:hypothetical protein